MPTPGIGDPYIYEWYVGLENVIKMLNPDLGISCVIFQHSAYDTIDDVVVEYKDNHKQLCYQVKHEIGTDGNDNLTFGSMLQSKNGKKCLFEAIYLGWKHAKTTSGSTIKPVLFTNRRITGRRSGRSDNGFQYSAYSVDVFVDKMKSIDNTNGQIDISDESLKHQWNELCSILIKDPIECAEVLSFLKDLTIMGNQMSLSEMKNSLVCSLSQTFSCDNVIALSLFRKLLDGLTKWVTTDRSDERVTIEDVYSALGVEEVYDESQHRLAAPYPFFESRKLFCDNLVTTIRNSKHKIVFLSGEPGSGKTSTISFLQSEYNLFLLRYHTFKPISPEQRYYNPDPGMCTPENLWGTLLIQLRKIFKGKLFQHKIPVSNSLLTVEQMREHVLRLLSILGHQAIAEMKTIYICIDGIDHAARAKTQLTFLDSLPMPDEIPEGVCFVIAGQPTAIYSEQYPIWLSTSKEIERFNLPKLGICDIKQLIKTHAKQFENEAEEIAELLFQKTDGNNLSTVFAVKEIETLNSVEEVVTRLNEKNITSDIQKYYNNIWSHMVSVLRDNVPAAVYPESIVACPIVLMNGYVNTEILANALKYGLTKADWAMVLDKLHPFVIKNEAKDEYSLFHNDFRVFLMGIIQSYKAKYEEIALSLAKYLLENDTGILTFVTGIPLLECANRKDLIPSYFTPEFVINALAEGISKQRLDEYAKLAYDSSCDYQDFNGYCNAYLSIKTIYQHIQYYEYYDKKYIVNDYPEISSIDISEIRSLPLEKNNLDEYYNVLNFCEKLYSSGKETFKERATGLYNKWYGNLSPASFAALCEDEISEESPWEIKHSEAGRVLQQWGKTAAYLNSVSPSLSEELTELESYAVLVFGEQYFNHCVNNKRYDLAMCAIKAGFINRYVFSEKLENIYYDGASYLFEEILTKVDYDAEKPSRNLLSLAMKVTCNSNFLPERLVIESSTSSTRIYDESTFTLILKSFLLGRIENAIEDNVLIDHVDLLYKDIEMDKNEISQVTMIVRLAALIGKYFLSNKPNSSELENLTNKFLSTSFYRSFDYSSAYKFLLYTLLQSQFSNSFGYSQAFIEALQKNLFEIGHLGMYYKSYILDYFVTQKHLDIIKKYINLLYGSNCEKMSCEENKAEMHSIFRSYGELVEPVLMQQFSDMLKWDVVGYSGHKEYALYAPLDYFNIITETEPQKWQDYGARLYKQSCIADLYDNRASYDIRKSISKSAIMSDFSDFWKLRNWSDEFRLDPNLIYHSLFEFAKKATNIDDLKAIWILSCGIHSWYTKEEHFAAKEIFNVCSRKADELNADFSLFVFESTPEWMNIIDSLSDSKDIYNSNCQKEDSQNTEENSAIYAKYAKLSIEESLNELFVISDKQNVRKHFQIVLEKILNEPEGISKNLEDYLNSFCIYLIGKEWRFEQCESIVEELLKSQGQETFWRFSRVIGLHLFDYEYQTSSRNMQFLLNQYCSAFSDKLHKMFSDELHTQELWITGNNHFKIDCAQTMSSSQIAPNPNSLSQMIFVILLEQINTQNARKIEAATFGLYLLGKVFFDIMDFIAKNWSGFSKIQIEYLLLVIAKWSVDGICTPAFLSFLRTMYHACNELSIKYYLHSILLLASDSEVEIDRISYDATSRHIALIDNGSTDNKSCFENFFKLIERYEINVDQIRKHIYGIFPLEKYKKDPYARNIDTKVPVISSEIDNILYDKDKSEAWNKIPLFLKKSRLLSPQDSFILTEMPHMVFDEKWDTGTYVSRKNGEKSEVPISILHDIVQYNIEDNDIILAARLWFPYGFNDGVIYSETSRISMRNYRYLSNQQDQCIGNYGLLSYEGNLDESVHSTVLSGGRNLFNHVCGCFNLCFGNCQLAPSSIWRKFLKCRPKKNNPYIWIDETGCEIMRLERIASPSRNLIQEPYIRQPMLFRWVANKEWIHTLLKEYDLFINYDYSQEGYPF